jgi:oligopeptide/dipeptide ABC transporter ATP-binding protein
MRSSVGKLWRSTWAWDFQSFERISALVGEVPSLLDPPPGSGFHPRCVFAMERCRVEALLLKEPGSNRRVACHLFPA